jgi:hypothetical protein
LCFSLRFRVLFTISATACSADIATWHFTGRAFIERSLLLLAYFVYSFPRFVTRMTVVRIHLKFLVVYDKGEDESTTLAVSVRCACNDDSFAESFFREPQFVRLPHVSGCFRVRLMPHPPNPVVTPAARRVWQLPAAAAVSSLHNVVVAKPEVEKWPGQKLLSLGRGDDGQ